MNFNLLNSIIFAGIIQGIIFVALVASNTKYQNKTIFFLLSLIVIYILYSLQYYLHDIRFFTDIKAFYGTLYINWTLAMAPLGLWHGLSIMYPNKKITLIQKAHIIPFVLGLFIIMYYKLAFRFQVEYPFLDVVLDLIVVKADIFAIFHNLLVLGMLAYHINSYKNLDPYIRQWVVMNLVIYGFIIVLWVILSSSHGYHTTEGEYYPLWISVSFMIYWFGYMGIMRYGIQIDRIHIRRKYSKRIRQKKQKKQSALQQFEYLFKEEKYYLNPLISQEEVARTLGISSSYLSTLLSDELKTSFNAYVNKLRTHEVVEMMSNPDFQQYNILSIGLESGFNSKTSFYTSFKKYMGYTPAQYKKMIA